MAVFGSDTKIGRVCFDCGKIVENRDVMVNVALLHAAQAERDAAIERAERMEKALKEVRRLHEKGAFGRADEIARAALMKE